MSSSNPNHSRSSSSSYQLRVAGSIAAAYFCFAELGHAVSLPGDFATFWMPSGVALAAYLSMKPHQWPTVLFATLAANLVSDVAFHDKSLAVSIGFWVTNSVESLTAVGLIRFFCSGRFELDTIERVLKFLLLPCLCSTAVGAAIGAGIVNLAFGGDYSSTWRIWWSGDFIGMLMTFPFIWCIIGGMTKSQDRKGALPSPPLKNRLQFVGLLSLLIAIAHFVFGLQNQRLAYAVFPPLLWLVVKFDLVGASAGLFAMAIVAVANTASGNGLFGEIEDLPTRAWVLQVFLFVSATTFLTLAATIRERREVERSLRKSQFTIDMSSDAVFWIRPDGSFAYANEKASEYLGYSTAELCTMSVTDINPAYPVEKWPDHWRETREAGTQSFEAVHTRKDGSQYDCDLQKAFVSFENEELVVATVRDITKNKLARKSLFRTQTALHTAADAVLWVNPEGRIIYANTEACRRLQYSESELTSRTVVDINPDLHSADEFRDNFWPRICQQQQLTLEMQHQRKDGSVFPVEIVTHYIEFEGEEFACSFIRDITERERIRSELEATQKQLRRAITGGNVGLWDWNILTGKVQYSEEWHQQLGAAPGTLTSFEDWEARLHPDDVEPAKATVSQALAVGKENYQSTFRMKHADGSYRWMLAQARLYCDENGKPLQMIGSHVDITELEETRAKLQAYLTLIGTTDGGWDWDLSTDVVDYSPRFRELLGFAPGGEFALSGSANTLYELMHSEDSERFRTQVEAHLQGKTTFEEEYRLKCQDGGYRWFRMRGNTTRDAIGKPRRMAGSIYDITDRKSAELQLLESNADLAQFANVASHDLQEPLRAIGGFCQLLEQRYSNVLDKTGQGYIRNAVEGVARLTALIQDLLAFSQVGRHENLFKTLQLNEVVESATQQISVAIQDSGATIDVDELPAIEGDFTMLTQLFQNLLSNAIKFRNPEVPLVVRIQAIRTKLMWNISIEDNGIGIDANYKDQIFNIFKRLHTREQIAGTGIGLAICKRIVDRHQGTIVVDSQLGTGSRFTIGLPIQ